MGPGRPQGAAPSLSLRHKMQTIAKNGAHGCQAVRRAYLPGRMRQEGSGSVTRRVPQAEPGGPLPQTLERRLR